MYDYTFRNDAQNKKVPVEINFLKILDIFGK